jgi:cytochrome c oxidase assembly protein subunit 15
MVQPQNNESTTTYHYIAPFAFGATVSMWAVAYVCRLPGVMAPAWLLLALLLAVVFFWGWYTVRKRGGGAWTAAAVGIVSSILNMMILGSLLTSSESHQVVPSALWWIPGSILATACVAALGGVVAKTQPAADDKNLWTPLLSKVALGATFLLVIAGGLVTSHEAGLAVVDWPNSYGYSMFLYPLARMTGGIYYEHAHRLFGSLVGLTTIALAIRLWRTDTRTWVKRAGIGATILVIVQGLLGGLRVTGGLTLSIDVADMAPNLALAVLHGIFGQLFLGLVVVLAVVTSKHWHAEQQQPMNLPDPGRTLHYWLVTTLIVQLILGALHRHLDWGLILHITLASVVTMLAIVGGARAWGLFRAVWPVQSLGQALLAVVSVQVALGIAAYAVTGGRAVVGNPSTVEITLATSHQAGGAALLCLSIALTLWASRITAHLPSR